MTEAYRGPTYYGRSQLKPSPFGFMVSLYIYLAGLSGSAQLLATIGDLFGGRAARGMVRRGRLLAMLGTAIGPGLLIADLHTPQRFYNMLRILRTTSPMSIGSYVLTSFGLTSTLTAAAQLLGDRIGGRAGCWLRGLGRAASVPASVTGSGLSVYTAALQSATSTPYWAASPRWLAVRYGASSVATAAAALSLLEHGRGDASVARRLDGLALGALLWSWWRAPARIGISGARGSRRRCGAARSTARSGAASSGSAPCCPLACSPPACCSAGGGGRSAPPRRSRRSRAASRSGTSSCWRATSPPNAPQASFALAQPRNLPRMRG